MENINNYSINEVAKMMGMTLKIVRRYVASGELKTTKNNNTYSISEEDFNAFKKYIKNVFQYTDGLFLFRVSLLFAHIATLFQIVLFIVIL